MATVEEIMKENDLKKKEATAFKRQVGRMPYEQVRTLFDENRKKRDDHYESNCDHCVWQKDGETIPCSIHRVMRDGWNLSDGYDAIKEIHRLEGECPNCVKRTWDYIESCSYRDELFELEQVYHHRISYLQTKEWKRRFEQAHGRPHVNNSELWLWTNTQPPIDDTW